MFHVLSISEKLWKTDLDWLIPHQDRMVILHFLTGKVPKTLKISENQNFQKDRHFLTFFRWIQCHGQHYPNPLSPPRSPNTRVPRSWRNLVALFTGIYQLQSGLIGLFRQISCCFLEHQQRLRLFVFLTIVGQQPSKPVGLRRHLYHVQSPNAGSAFRAS